MEPLPRLPRFERASSVAPIEITARDCEIIRRVYQHRFVRSSHIISLLGGSSQQIVRRLQLLFHHGYLERPRCQLDYYHRGGSRQIVYGLSDKGAALLRHTGMTVLESRSSEKNRSVGRVQLEHTLLVSEVMVTLETACRQQRIRLLIGEELMQSGVQSFRWKADIGGGVVLGVVPDRVFALEYSDRERPDNRAYFFLEADRGTMPVVRKGLNQTSFYRKLLSYAATWSQDIHLAEFGFNRFRVLTVTKSTERVQSLLQACSMLQRGRGLFLFAHEGALKNPCDILGPIWQTVNSGACASLID